VAAGAKTRGRRLVFSDASAGLVDEPDARASSAASWKSDRWARPPASPPGSAELWAEVWLRLVLLALDRIARGTWKADEPAVQQVFEAAWDAIRGERPQVGGGGA
jgi:hypothetical protein